MKQLKLTLLLTVLMSMVGAKAFAYDFKSGGIYYRITSSTDKTVEVTYQSYTRQWYDDDDPSVPTGFDYIRGYDDDGDSYYYYTTSDYSGSVSIPSSVYYNGQTYQVMGIGDMAFMNCPNVSSITLLSSITTIGNYAFQNCGFAVMDINATSLSSIGYNAFLNCSKLKTVNLNSIASWMNCSLNGYSSSPFCNGADLYIANEEKTTISFPVTTIAIPTYAFYGCRNITSVSIPALVTSIGVGAFSNCVSLATINVNTNNGSYCSDEGILYNSDKSELIVCPGAKSGALTIPSSVTSIKEYACYGCTQLTSVTIPKSVTRIGTQAFTNVSGKLELNCRVNSYDDYYNYSPFYNSQFNELILGDDVIFIGNYAFNGCTTITTVNVKRTDAGISSDRTYYSLPPTSATWNYYLNDKLVTELNVPSGITHIGNRAFYNAKGITSVNLPSTLASIGYLAFTDCTNMVSVSLPNSLTSIGNSAFSGCSSLTATILPSSLTSIGSDAFKDCRGKLTVNCNIPNYSFNNAKFSEVVVGNGVTSIGGYAFYNCSTLSSVTFPNTLTQIGDCAFQGCTGLDFISLPGSLQSIGYSAFNGCSFIAFICKATTPPALGSGNTFAGKKKIYVPYASMDAYKNAWSQLAEPTYTYLPLLDVMFFEKQTAESYTAELMNKAKAGITSVAFYEGGLDADLTEEVMKNGMNPNCLYYVPAEAGLSGNNIITLDGYEAANVSLTDNYPYDCPIPFHTNMIEYVHNPSVWANGSAGWETICLPFAPESFMASDRGYISPIMLGSNGNFWLRKFVGASSDAVYFQSTIDGVMEANTPYLVAFPGSTMGTGHLEGQTITFIGSNADIDVTQQPELKKNDYIFVGNYDSNADGVEGWALNATGSSFVKSGNVGNQPFRAYFKNEAGEASSPELRVSFGESTDIRSLVTNSSDFTITNDSNGTLLIQSDGNRSLNIYSVDGRLVRRVQLSKGENNIERLTKGIYIIDNQKVIVR